MQLVQVPALRPFVCVDGTQTGPIVDTLVNIPVFGRIYLSRQMLRNAAREMPDVVEEVAAERGWVSPADAQVAEDLIAELREELAEQQAIVADAHPRILAEIAAIAKFGDTVARDEPIRQRPATGTRQSATARQHAGTEKGRAA